MLQENKKKDKAEKENEKNNEEMTKGDPSNAFFSSCAMHPLYVAPVSQGLKRK